MDRAPNNQSISALYLKNVKDLCYCWPEGESCSNSTCRASTNEACFASAVAEDCDVQLKFGCVQKEHMLMTCDNKLQSVTVHCCKPALDGNYCNQQLEPHVAPCLKEKVGIDGEMVKLCLAIALPILVCFILVTALICMWRKRKTPNSGHTGFNALTTKEKLPPDLEMESGSGRGWREMVQRRVHKHIDLETMIGRGGHAEVWSGSYAGEKVAVKIFPSRDEVFWGREVEIYETVSLRHENILAFLAADLVCSGHSCIQYWLITYYHENGSLFDHLQDHRPDVQMACKFALSIASGLAHLHTEIFGTHGKPGIAHRDMKSKNVMVKADLTCCIGDFGHAVLWTRDRGLNVHGKQRVGTKRYMGPELLDESVDPSSFDSFKQLDVYAYALVLWEILYRSTSDTYKPPFYLQVGGVGSDPSFEDMQKIVVEGDIRPEVNAEWASNEVLGAISKLMSQCWGRMASGRLTTLRVKKTLLKLQEQQRCAVCQAAGVLTSNLPNILDLSCSEKRKLPLPITPLVPQHTCSH